MCTCTRQAAPILAFDRAQHPTINSATTELATDLAYAMHLSTTFDGGHTCVYTTSKHVTTVTHAEPSFVANGDLMNNPNLHYPTQHTTAINAPYTTDVGNLAPSNSVCSVLSFGECGGASFSFRRGANHCDVFTVLWIGTWQINVLFGS